MAAIAFEMVDGAVTCSMNGCQNDSSVYVTSGALDLVRTPFCSVCAPYKFAQWMLKMHVDPESIRNCRRSMC